MLQYYDAVCTSGFAHNRCCHCVRLRLLLNRISETGSIKIALRLSLLRDPVVNTAAMLWLTA